jgi:hypothetical protein
MTGNVGKKRVKWGRLKTGNARVKRGPGWVLGNSLRESQAAGLDRLKILFRAQPSGFCPPLRPFRAQRRVV